MLANIYGGLGLWDIFGGSALTFVAAVLTWLIGLFFKTKTNWHTYVYKGSLLGLLPPVIVNAFGVAYILKVVLELPYWISVLYVGIGQTIAVYFLGYPLLIVLLRRRFLLEKEDS